MLLCQFVVAMTTVLVVMIEKQPNEHAELYIDELDRRDSIERVNRTVILQIDKGIKY